MINTSARTQLAPLGSVTTPPKIAPVPVLHPLEHVPQHVVQTVSVRRLLSYRIRAISTILSVPRDQVQVRSVTIPGTTRPRRVLPLRLRQQPVLPPSFPRVELPDKLLHLTSRDLFHRAPPASRGL